MTASSYSSLTFFSQCRPAKEQEKGIEEDEEIDDIGELPAAFNFTEFEDVPTELSKPDVSERSKERREAATYMPQQHSLHSLGTIITPSIL